MIDISSETVTSLTEATQHLPRRRRNKRPATATIYRWAQRGVRGVVLETIQVGGTKCTSVEALQRFCDRLTNATRQHPTPSSAGRTKQREKEIVSAERECEAEGVCPTKKNGPVRRTGPKPKECIYVQSTNVEVVWQEAEDDEGEDR